MKKIAIENFLKMTPEIPQYSQKNQNYLIAGANPISYLDTGVQEEQIAPLSASLDWLNINPFTVDSYDKSNRNAGVKLYLGSTDNYAQSFSVTTMTTLGSVQAYISVTDGGSISGSTIYAEVFAHTGTYGVNGTPTGTRLAISGGSTLGSGSSGYTLMQFTFTGANKITLAANTKYVVVINFAAGNATNYITIGTSTSLTAAGNASYSTNGTSWTVDSTQDMIFYVLASGSSSVILDGNIVHMIPSTEGTYSAYAITDTTKVYGITTTSITDLGYPSGGSVANSGGYLAIGGGGTTSAGYLFVTYPTSTVFKMTLPSSSWTNFGSITSNSGIHIIEPFLDFIALKDGSASFTQGGLIKKIDVTAFTITVPPSAGIDLGAGWGILQMRNYNNKYLAIAAGKTGVGGGSEGYAQNYIFLWNGTGLTYQYSIKVPGQFIDMKVIDSVLYVAVKVANGKTCLYQLVNTSLRKVLTTQYSKIYNSPVDGLGGNAPISCALFDFKNYPGIHLNTTSDISDPLLIHGSDEMGNLDFIHSYGRRMEVLTPGYDGNIFASQYIPSGNSTVYYLPLTGTNYQNIFYKSQWINVKNLQAIDIYYDTPPNSGTDAINVTIYGQGEDIIAGSSTTSLSSITPTNKLTAKRTRIDVQGFTGDQLMIQLATVNSTWQPIIRAIVTITI